MKTNSTDVRETLRQAYCQASDALQDYLRPLVGKVVGKVRVSAPQEYHDAGYECAAWWEDRVSTTGVFDVIIGHDPHEKNRIFFFARIPATVKADFFPALWCGNLIGDPYDTTKNAGNRCADVIITIAALEGVLCAERSGDDEKGLKWAILPECWDMVKGYCAALLMKYRAYYAYASHVYENDAPDKWLSQLSQVGHACEHIRKAADGIRRIHDAQRYRAERSTDYFTINNPFAV